jgi:hypothetical protein
MSERCVCCQSGSGPWKCPPCRLMCRHNFHDSEAVLAMLESWAQNTARTRRIAHERPAEELRPAAPIPAAPDHPVTGSRRAA